MRNKKIIGSLIILSALTLFSGTSVFAKSKEATYKDGETILPKEAFYESETGNSVGGCDSYTERMIPTPTVKKDDATPTIQPSVTPTPIEDTSVTPTPINTEVPTDTPSQTPTDTPTDEPTVTPTETPLEQDQRIWEGAKLNKEELYRAKTTTYKLQLVDIPSDTGNYIVQWASSNTRVAVDDNGQITAKKTGEAVITAKITTENGYTKTLRCYVTVTNPKFAKSTYIFAKSVEWDLEILGTDTTDFSISSSNTSVVKVYKSQPGLIKARSEGKAKITVTVDGLKITTNVIVTNPKLKKKLFVMTANQSAQLSVLNLNKNSKVKIKSLNPKIASVSSKGKIKTLKVGVAVIQVQVDGKILEATVAVGKEKPIKAIKNAQKALGAKYSQPRRMWKGYYDCSSLVWRSFVKTGINFGVKKNASNAPTAAMECYYLVNRKKEIAKGYVSTKKLRPGDLIFISNGKNGRFKNITHVAIYIGNNIIIHATTLNDATVQYGTYSYYADKIVSICRPS